jgi:hypothetical protein
VAQAVHQVTILNSLQHEMQHGGRGGGGALRLKCCVTDTSSTVLGLVTGPYKQPAITMPVPCTQALSIYLMAHHPCPCQSLLMFLHSVTRLI